MILTSGTARASRSKRRRWIAFVLFIAIAGAPFTVYSQSRETVRVSVDSLGVQADGGSDAAAISGDGRFVSFTSVATNLVADDSNGLADIFVHDRLTGETTRISVDSEGNQATGASLTSDISADGTIVAFAADAPNLVDGDTNGARDVFVQDRGTGQTTRVSVATNGDQSNGISDSPSISADGRYVAFRSSASNFADPDTGSAFDFDIFIHDRVTGETTRVSEAPGGAEANDNSQNPSISADGRFVAFESLATNLVPGDINGDQDIFVYDHQSGEISRASVADNGDEGNSSSSGTAISGTGRYVVFRSQSDNLTPEPLVTPGIYVRDRELGRTALVSVSTEGVPAIGATSSQLAISDDGRFVAFLSRASNLVDEPINNNVDKLFVRDRREGQTTRASDSSAGLPAERGVASPAISGDGEFVAFHSLADNLVADDTNGSLDVFVSDPLFVRVFKDRFEPLPQP